MEESGSLPLSAAAAENRTGAGEQRAKRGGGAHSGSGRRSGSGRPAGNPSAPSPRAPARSSCEQPRARSMGSGTAPTGRAQRRNRRAERWTERRRWGSARGVCAHHINLCAEPRHTVALFLWLHAKTSLCRPVLDGPAAVHFFLCPNATVQSCRDTGGAGAAPRTDAAMWLKRYSGLCLRVVH